MTHEEQRQQVMATHKELMQQRRELNRAIEKNLEFFTGKEAKVRHSRGQLSVRVRKVYADETMSVENLNTANVSTRLLAELVSMIEPDSE